MTFQDEPFLGIAQAQVMDLCQILMLSRSVHETEVRKMDRQPGRAGRIRAIVKKFLAEIAIKYKFVFIYLLFIKQGQCAIHVL